MHNHVNKWRKQDWIEEEGTPQYYYSESGGLSMEKSSDWMVLGLSFMKKAVWSLLFHVNQFLDTDSSREKIFLE